MSSLQESVSFILTQAGDTDIDRIIDAVKERRKILSKIRAASVAVGAPVRLDGLSPRYLNGLTGTVTKIDGNRCTVTLDEESTERLRWGRTRFHIPASVKEYPLTGIPLGCAHLHDGVAA